TQWSEEDGLEANKNCKGFSEVISWNGRRWTWSLEEIEQGRVDAKLIMD
ncbi:hypothetical protein A2U01_0008248, partial [Trifolium medium]|nr:hypothetical protein [Trifolium medium]